MKRCAINLIVLIVVALVAIAGTLSVKFLGPDNVVEQVSEDVIKDEIGVSVDLSPETPESTHISQESAANG